MKLLKIHFKFSLKIRNESFQLCKGYNPVATFAVRNYQNQSVNKKL